MLISVFEFTSLRLIVLSDSTARGAKITSNPNMSRVLPGLICLISVKISDFVCFVIISLSLIYLLISVGKSKYLVSSPGLGSDFFVTTLVTPYCVNIEWTILWQDSYSISLVSFTLIPSLLITYLKQEATLMFISSIVT